MITYDILRDFYGTLDSFKPCDWLSSRYIYPFVGLYPISPMFGIEVELAKFMQSQHVVKNEKERAAPGSEFDLKDFHTVVPENGAVPLTVLEQLVHAWVVKGGGPPHSSQALPVGVYIAGILAQKADQ